MKNIYLDYSATTKVDDNVLEVFINASKYYYANANSNHQLGKECNNKIKEAINNMTKYFNIKEDELIFTSGASEANNTIIKGLKITNKNEIITTRLEHSSIYAPLNVLQKEGYIIKFVPLNKDGSVNIKELENMISDKTLLVSIGMINSEMGIKQNINEIGQMLHKHNILFHSDITQGLGKVNINLDNVDFASFSGHKIYAPKGIGGLIIKNKVKINNLINGGKSTTKYRSGTPQNELILSLSSAFDLFKDSINDKYNYVKELNEQIRKHISKYNNIVINSPEISIPHILNISFIGKDSNTIQSYFNDNGIYLSTKTACASDNSYSLGVYEITSSQERATSSVRISLSYKTTYEEINYFLSILDKLMEEYHEIN